MTMKKMLGKRLDELTPDEQQEVVERIAREICEHEGIDPDAGTSFEPSIAK